MTQLDRYLVRSVLGPTLLAFAVAATLGIAIELNERSSNIIVQVLTATDIARLGIYVLPSLLPLVLSVTLFFGLLAGYGKLADRGELTAMFAAGVSVRRIFAPALGLALLATAISIAMQHYVQPRAIDRAYRLLREELPSRATVDRLGPGVVHKVDNWRVYFADSNPRTGEIYGVDLVKFEMGQGPTVFHADSARVESDGISQSLILGRGFTVTRDGIRTSTERTVVRVPHEQMNPSSTRARMMASVAQLQASELELAAAAGDSPSPKDQITLRKLRQEIADRLSLPFSTIALAAVAPPLVLGFSHGRRSARVRAFAWGLAIAASYYLVRVTLQPESLVSLETVLALAWVPNLALILLACGLYWRAVRAAG